MSPGYYRVLSVLSMVAFDREGVFAVATSSIATVLCLVCNYTVLFRVASTAAEIRSINPRLTCNNQMSDTFQF